VLVSQTVEYALRAVLQIARDHHRAPVRVGDIADALDVPRNYLSKTLHRLASAGVLTSARGPTGGFQLATAPDKLTLAEIAAPFVAVGKRTCLLGQPACGDDRPCAAHSRWKLVAQQAEDFFARTTVADLLAHGKLPEAPPGGRRRQVRATR
jgi:Rrf2 family iron-sulfur cluster assembly transcriptional regulator